MKTQKEKDIEAFLAQPIQVGDSIYVKGLGSKDKTRYGTTTVVEIKGDQIGYKEYGYRNCEWVHIDDVKRSTDHIGVNPFKPFIRNDSHKIDIQTLLWRLGVDKDGESKMERYFNVDIPEVCFNPMVVVDGEETEYQRGLVWTMDQKQLLIESIYNRIEIGKFVFRVRPFNWVEQRVKAGQFEHTAFKDLVDGKQRATTIIAFINNEFEDLQGRFFDDFSGRAKREFLNYNNLTYVELPEETTDDQVLETFLAINHTGVPMSKEHIEFVKSLRK